jgi:antibiotic biosynthesis monooxygenase (ABM) superfamily enzyme
VFVQVIRFRSKRPEEIRAMSEEYETTMDQAGPGPIGSEVLRVASEPDTYIALARFTSAEKARENSGRAETNEWYRKFTALIDGEPEFIDTEQIYEHWVKAPVA